MTGTWRYWKQLTATVALLVATPVYIAHAQDAPIATTQSGAPSAQQQAYCRQLERQLAPGWQQAAGSHDSLASIESQIAKADQLAQRGQAAAEKADCFDYFLFSKSWRSTAQCRQIHQQIDDAQRAMADLERQRKTAGSAQDNASQQEALVNELARYRCGAQYEAALQRRNGGGTAGFWSDGEGGGQGGGQGGGAAGFAGGVPGSTFRTICVRMCDGYYFPISFATTQDRFQHDAQTCQSQCGGPAKLYYYPNPGGEVQQAVSTDGAAYTALPNAFRYRKERVASCSCNGAGPGVDSVADTQPMMQPGLKTAQPAAVAGGAPANSPAASDDAVSGQLPATEFGTMSVEPAQNN